MFKELMESQEIKVDPYSTCKNKNKHCFRKLYVPYLIIIIYIYLDSGFSIEFIYSICRIFWNENWMFTTWWSIVKILQKNMNRNNLIFFFDSTEIKNIKCLLRFCVIVHFENIIKSNKISIIHNNICIYRIDHESSFNSKG